MLRDFFFRGWERCPVSNWEGSIISVVEDKLPLRAGSAPSLTGVDRTGITSVVMVMIVVELPAIICRQVLLELGAIMKKPFETTMPGPRGSRYYYDIF